MANPTDPQNFSEVQLWIKERIASRQFKNCTHLTINQILQPGYGSTVTYFVPKCDRMSFAWPVPGFDDQTRIEMLLRSMGQGNEIISCPAECLCYESQIETQLAQFNAKKAAAAREKRQRRWARLVGPIKAAFGWFSNLPWQTQIAIIVLGLLAFSPKWVPQLILLIKALAELIH